MTNRKPIVHIEDVECYSTSDGAGVYEFAALWSAASLNAKTQSLFDGIVAVFKKTRGMTITHSCAQPGYRDGEITVRLIATFKRAPITRCRELLVNAFSTVATLRGPSF